MYLPVKSGFYAKGIVFAKSRLQVPSEVFVERAEGVLLMIMRLLILILVLSFLVITGTVMSADGHTLTMIN